MGLYRGEMETVHTIANNRGSEVGGNVMASFLATMLPPSTQYDIDMQPHQRHLGVYLDWHGRSRSTHLFTSNS